MTTTPAWSRCPSCWTQDRNLHSLQVHLPYDSDPSGGWPGSHWAGQRYLCSRTTRSGHSAFTTATMLSTILPALNTDDKFCNLTHFIYHNWQFISAKSWLGGAPRLCRISLPSGITAAPFALAVACSARSVPTAGTTTIPLRPTLAPPPWPTKWAIIVAWASWETAAPDTIGEVGMNVFQSYDGDMYPTRHPRADELWLSPLDVSVDLGFPGLPCNPTPGLSHLTIKSRTTAVAEWQVTGAVRLDGTAGEVGPRLVHDHVCRAHHRRTDWSLPDRSGKLLRPDARFPALLAGGGEAGCH